MRNCKGWGLLSVPTNTSQAVKEGWKRPWAWLPSPLAWEWMEDDSLPHEPPSVPPAPVLAHCLSLAGEQERDDSLEEAIGAGQD